MGTGTSIPSVLIILIPGGWIKGQQTGWQFLSVSTTAESSRPAQNYEGETPHRDLRQEPQSCPFLNVLG